MEEEVEGEEEEEEEEVRGEVRLPVVVNDSSTQQHSPSQPSIFFPFGVPSSLMCEGSSGVSVYPQARPKKRFTLFYSLSS